MPGVNSVFESAGTLPVSLSFFPMTGIYQIPIHEAQLSKAMGHMVALLALICKVKKIFMKIN
jgi:hypothetical protein